MGYQVTPVKGLASLRNTKQDHYKKHPKKHSVPRELWLGPDTQLGCWSTALASGALDILWPSNRFANIQGGAFRFPPKITFRQKRVLP